MNIKNYLTVFPKKHIQNCIKYSFLLLLFFLFATNTYAQIHFFASFDDISIAYTDEGKGEPIVLIHGFISNGSSWNGTVIKNQLLDLGYRVIVPDLRGNGKSDKPHTPNAYKDDVEIKDLPALANHLNLKKYHAIGYSRGSIILAKLLTVDKRIKKAILGGWE